MAYTTFATQPIGIFSAIGSFFKSVLSSLQYARMISVLTNMTDVQLAQIGITRSEIPAYADTLMGRDA